MIRLSISFLLLTTFAHAQVPDSLFQKYDSLSKSKTSKIDSTSSHFNSKVDSIQSRLNNILNPNLNQLTSKFRNRKRAVPDSVKAVHELDSIKGGLTHKIDSLKGLGLPTDRYTRKLDSVKQIGPARYIQSIEAEVNALEGKANKPVNDLTRKVNDPVNKLEDRINKPIDNVEGKVNEKLDLMRKEGGTDANIPGALKADVSTGDVLKNTPGVNTDLDVADKLKAPDANLDVNNPLGNIDNPIEGKMDGLNDIKEKASDLKSGPQEQLNKVKSIDEIKTAKDKIGDLNKATDKVQAYGDDVKNVAQGDIGEVKEIPDAIESKARDIDALKDLEKQNAEIGKVKELAGQGKDPEAMKEMAKKEVLSQARDHFAGKQEALEAAMQKMTKLKSKYPEITSMKDLPKRAPNPMKKKTLVERVVPGVTLQIIKERNFMIDINPVVSYRFTGRINAGFGWNERLSFSKWNKLEPFDRIYGGRVFGTYSFKKGFSVKADIERMNAFIPALAINPDAGSRQWLWSAFVGIKKDYKFFKSVKGNVQILYNIYDDQDSSPYPDRLNVRMGFEFPMKKVKKPAGKQVFPDH
jgi:archaellum component FlaC